MFIAIQRTAPFRNTGRKTLAQLEVIPYFGQLLARQKLLFTQMLQAMYLGQLALPFAPYPIIRFI
jgi:hypothetical protein